MLATREARVESPEAKLHRIGSAAATSVTMHRQQATYTLLPACRMPHAAYSAPLHLCTFVLLHTLLLLLCSWTLRKCSTIDSTAAVVATC